MASGISLANKCQLLFGASIVAIIVSAMMIPWSRTKSAISASSIEIARQVADAWLLNGVQMGPVSGASDSATLEDLAGEAGGKPSLRLMLVPATDIEPDDSDQRPFQASALRRFQDDASRQEYSSTTTVKGRTVYRYARPVRESQLRAVRDPAATAIVSALPPPDAGNPDPLRAILVIDRAAPAMDSQRTGSRVWLIAAAIVACVLAGLVFHFILTKLIFSPVRRLRETAEKVRSGDVRIRANLKTGDEFEQLSDAFNSMLERLEQGQAQLKAMNETANLKLSELSEANVGLYESNRLKSEFVASVSHELRTPLNSIIGFAELLDEIAKSEPEANPKRARYIGNILTSGRSLLEMINELLDMAKIEAGRMEVNIEQTSVGELIEGLVGIMRPQAEAKQITLRTVIGQRLPTIETDPGKLQQILYNFMSNAIKFTPGGPNGSVTISADRVTRQDNTLGVRIAVADSGPGIPYDMQDVIFEKFRQVDASHTRQHAGTGLGLAICKELAEMLGAGVSFVSEPGRGATFYVDLPQSHQAEAPQPLMG